MLNQFEIKSIFDAPCGDFNWMKEIILVNDIRYHGVDIVSNIIDSNIRKYSSQRINFSQGDLTKMTFSTIRSDDNERSIISSLISRCSIHYKKLFNFQYQILTNNLS